MNTAAIKNILLFLVIVFFVFYFFISVLGSSDDKISLKNFVIGEDLLTIKAQLNSVFSDEEILSYVKNFKDNSLFPKIDISISETTLLGRRNPFSFVGPPPRPENISILSELSTASPSDSATISTPILKESAQDIEKIEEKEIEEEIEKEEINL